MNRVLKKVVFGRLHLQASVKIVNLVLEETSRRQPQGQANNSEFVSALAEQQGSVAILNKSEM